MFICLCKFEIIQYILKYKCSCIYILAYYTYSGTEYLDSLFVNVTWVLRIVYLVVFLICASSWRVLYEHPQGANTKNVYSIKVYLLNLLFLALMYSY